jgi:hypothetical protein
VCLPGLVSGSGRANGIVNQSHMSVKSGRTPVKSGRTHGCAPTGGGIYGLPSSGPNLTAASSFNSFLT